MAETILRQTILMLLLMMCGALCYKLRIITPSANRELSGFVLQVVNPVMIFMSYQTEYRAELVQGLLICFALSAAVLFIIIAAVYILIPERADRQTEVERFSAIYSNCGFMGIPLVNALFGMQGVFYLTAFITVFNLVVWTHGIILISGEKDLHQVVKVFYSPTVIAIVLGIICFFARLTLPTLISDTLGYISGLNTPLAMVVSGVTMAQTSFAGMLKKPGVYRVCAVRLLIVPAILAALLTLTPARLIDQTVRVTVIAAASAPPAAMCTLQCLRYGRDSLYASEIFTAGTLLSVFSLPAIIALTEYLTKITS